MHYRIRGLRFACALLLVSAGLTLSACGSSSSDASSLLKQTFSGAHTVNSGNLSFSVTVDPSGSSTLRGPIMMSFGGPFQSLGKGKLPASDFNISIHALGKTGSIGVLSTGTNGYVNLQGTSYQMPAATFQRLESSFAQVTASPSGSSGSGALGKLGINPLRWLTNPTVVGNETVAGAATTHIRAGVNVDALLADLNTFLQKASSAGVTGANRIPTTIPNATRSRIASEVKNVGFDVWTGTSDKNIRRLSIKLTLPVSGQIASLLGGLRSADIGLSMQYANLNQSQTINAPGNVRPFSEFSSKLRSLLSTIQSAIAPGATGSSGGTGAPGGSGSTGGTGTPGGGGSIGGAGTGGGTGTTGGAATGANLQNYSRCIQAAAGNVPKMQRCGSLLRGH